MEYIKDLLEKISDANKGQIPWTKGKRHSAEHKRKLRISTIKYIKENGGISPRLGANEKALLDLQEQDNDCKIHRNYEIKELGYFVDGYDDINNRVYEVYERFHDDQVSKDLKREWDICENLNCHFTILYDRTH